jgi:hypothetical protein
MQYLLAPLDKHYDSGFGATAEAFFRAARALAEKGDEKFFLGHLPHNYLLRHAVELFLKSGIVILHRKLKLAFDTESPDSSPKVLVRDGSWKPFHRVHSIQDLYRHWKGLIQQNAAELKELSPNHPEWEIPEELDTWIAAIEQTDSGSTYYRYPVTRDASKDAAKSSFKESSVEGLFVENRPNDEWVRALVVKNQAGEAVAAYRFDYQTESQATEALVGASDTLNNFHAMMRFELTDGW